MITIHHEIDIERLHATIDEALALDDNEELFAQLTSVIEAKKAVTDLLEQVERVERDAKNAINAKAKKLYGNDWQAIVGNGYKISRYHAGSIYNRIEGEKLAKKFLKIEEKLNTEAIDAYIEEKEQLPAGLEYNNQRTEVIKVALR